MNNTDKTERTPFSAAGFPLAVFRLLGSLRFALGVVLLITAACVAGTLIPQGYQVGKFLERYPEAQRRMEILDTLGLTHVFFSRWFVVLLCVLAASLLVCTFRRFQALRGAVGAKRIRVCGSLFTHISLLLVLVGGVIRAVWGEKGYIELREGETIDQFVGSHGMTQLPFAVRLADFTLELYGESDRKQQPPAERLLVAWPEKGLMKAFPAVVGVPYEVTAPGGTADADTCRVTIRRYFPDFYIDTVSLEGGTRSDEPNNPAVSVEVIHAGQYRTNWIFARFPDFGEQAGAENPTDPLHLRYEVGMSEPSVGRSGAIKAYKSRLQILTDGKPVCEKTIAVNAPLSYGGYTFYQSGYNPKDLKWTSLQVVRDPGVIIVYIGFVLMMVGLTLVFWVAPMAETGKPKDGVVS
ncbi:MAG: cytochrome c biogenesis protein ResB [Kiritimatiellia bacterium]